MCIHYFVLKARKSARILQASLPKAIETPDSSAVRRFRQTMMIDQRPLLWPTFGIKNKIFEGSSFFVFQSIKYISSFQAVNIL